MHQMSSFQDLFKSGLSIDGGSAHSAHSESGVDVVGLVDYREPWKQKGNKKRARGEGRVRSNMNATLRLTE